MGYALKTVVLAPRPDGQLAPAWGRLAGNVGSSLIENTWLPPRLTTPKGTALRTVYGLVGRLAATLWVEFGPDLRKRFSKRSSDSLVSPAPAR